MNRRVLAIALAINVVGASGFAQRIDFSGTWRLDREASTIITAEGLAGLGEPAPADLHLTHAANGGLIISSRVNGAQPRAYLVEGGSTVPAPGGGTMLVATRWRNGALVSEGSARVDGNTVGIREVMTLSADGRTLTLEVTTTSPSGAETNTLVYRKAG